MRLLSRVSARCCRSRQGDRTRRELPRGGCSDGILGFEAGLNGPLSASVNAMQDLPFREALSPEDLVCIQSLNPHSDGRSNAKILRISDDGIELISPIAVFPGTLIQLRHEGAFLLGEARCCRAVGSTFQIGVDVEDAFLTQQAG